jgi:polyhydroxyalkanoate synthesis regulator phasin
MPVPPAPADPQQNAPENSNIRNSQRAILQQREKTFRDSLEALSERVNQLKQEVQALHSSEVFSVRIYKQAGEIERLAKQLKTLAKG